jgi:F0F1-type ATP synthase assembly protein I
MGGICALVLIAPLGLGFVADRYLRTLPVFTLIGLVVGIGLAARYIYMEFRRFLQD